MEFVFVNVKEPSDALQLAKESEIRSHVTRYQWKKSENRPASTRKRKNGSRPIQLNIENLHINLQAPPQDATAEPQNVTKRESPNNCIIQTPPFLIPQQLGGLRVDPFQTYPIPLKPFTPFLVDHCMWILDQCRAGLK